MHRGLVIQKTKVSAFSYAQSRIPLVFYRSLDLIHTKKALLKGIGRAAHAIVADSVNPERIEY
jgi:hypothetical protein